MNKSGIRTTRGTEISVNSTTRMLHNRRYIGEYTFRDITVKDGIPAIITKELFDRTQARMERTKKAPSQHKAEDDYILTTKLRCGKCKCFMIGESGTSHTEKTVHHYYKCVSVKKHRGCDKKTVRKTWIEDLVINKVKELIMDDDLINRICDMVVEELGKESSALPVLKKQLKDVEKGINNMLDAIQSGIKTPSIKQRAEELENRKEELSILILQEEMKKPIISRDLIEAWIKHFRKYDISKLEERQRLVDHFVNVIYLYEDHFDLFLNFREGAVTITFDENMLKAAKPRKSKKTNISSDLTPSTAPNKNLGNDKIIYRYRGFLFAYLPLKQGFSSVVDPFPCFGLNTEYQLCFCNHSCVWKNVAVF